MVEHDYDIITTNANHDAMLFVDLILNKDKPLIVKIGALFNFGCLNNDFRINCIINQPYFNN